MASLQSVAGRLGRLLPRRPPAPSTWLYAAWTAAWFLLALLLTFPHDLVVRHWADELQRDSGWQIRYGEVWLRPWSGYHLSDARLIAPGKDAEPWIAAEQVVLSPSWLTLFGRGGFPLAMSGSAYGGSVSGSVGRSGALDLEWSGLRLADYPHLTRLVEGRWAGEISGEIHLGGQGDLRTLEGRGKVRLRDGALTQGKAQGFVIPDLHFASGDGEFEFKAGRLDVRSLKLSGAEIDAELRGQIYWLGAGSVPLVSATLGLRPVPGAPAGLEPLLMLLHRNQRPPDGTYSFTLYGPLGAVRVR
ncbi:MAG: type II secretion system protein GspN [Deltaproteobacteria bacterium]|nr:type II secretion system protein GspN [Deltaproteobacteria bacterium]